MCLMGLCERVVFAIMDMVSLRMEALWDLDLLVFFRLWNERIGLA
jgi:hypothetical protein